MVIAVRRGSRASRALEAPRRLEASPYVVAKDASVITDNAFDRASHATLGGDLKYRVASNLTLDATVNPDFGEVEADPAVLNLSAYESFFDRAAAVLRRRARRCSGSTWTATT